MSIDPKKCQHKKWLGYKRCRKKTTGITAGPGGRCMALYCAECGYCIGCEQIHKVTIKKSKDK